MPFLTTKKAGYLREKTPLQISGLNSAKYLIDNFLKTQKKIVPFLKNDCNSKEYFYII